MKKKILFVVALVALMLPVSSILATTKVNCGNVTNIPAKIPELTRFAITLVQVAVPILLVVMGSLDFFKAITAQKEEEIKKGQQMFIKRLIVAVLIFFVIAIVKIVVSVVAKTTTETSNMIDCIDCFLSDKSSCEEV